MRASAQGSAGLLPTAQLNGRHDFPQTQLYACRKPGAVSQGRRAQACQSEHQGGGGPSPHFAALGRAVP